jgi:uncharacterized membrane protein
MPDKKKSSMRYAACDCNCCQWQHSPTLRIILAVIFLAIVVDLAVTVFLGPRGYLTSALSGFVGLVFLIIFAGWLLSIACPCKGRHWVHGADVDPKEMARMRYAQGEITKKEYSDIVKGLKA